MVGAGAGVAIASAGGDEPQPVEVVATDFALTGSGDASAITPAPPVPPVPQVRGFRAAESLVPMLEAFAAPGAVPGTPAAAALPNPQRDGRLLVVGILDTDPSGQWLYAQLPQRPNGSTGWIRASDVRVFDVANRIEVNVTTNQLRVLRGDSAEVLFEATVATGAPSTPTPLGEYFIDIWNPLGQHPTYGWGQLSVSGFSDVLYSFGGGIGQIAIHGWNNDSVMGRNVSNGCVRMRNVDIARVAELTGLGTPVRIVA